MIDLQDRVIELTDEIVRLRAALERMEVAVMVAVAQETHACQKRVYAAIREAKATLAD